jgi:hypothetical protein
LLILFTFILNRTEKFETEFNQGVYINRLNQANKEKFSKLRLHMYNSH